MLRKGKMLASLEAIKFQSDTFFRELTATIAPYKGKKRAKVFDDDLAAKLAAVILHHTQLEVDIYMGSPKSANHDAAYAIMNVRYTVNSSIYEIDELTRLSSLPKKVVSFSLNERTGKATINGNVFVPVVCVPCHSVIGSFFTAEEDASFILHEIGHYVGTIEFMGRLGKTNEALMEIAHGYDKTDDYKERVAIVAQATRNLPEARARVQELAKSKTVAEVSVMVADTLLEEHRNELGADQHDRTIFEAYADRYATRYGAGLALITANAKYDKLIHEHHRQVSRNSMWGLIGSMVVAGLSAMAGQVGFTVLSVISGLMYAVGLVSLGMASKQAFKYDEDQLRKERIRHQMSLVLRDKTLSKEQVNFYKAQLEEADDILATSAVDPVMRSWSGRIFSRAQRAFLKQSDVAKEYEALAFNQLFERSQYLRTA